MKNILDVGAVFKEIYRPRVESTHPELVEAYGFDAVWDALGRITPEPCLFCGEVV